MSDILHEIKKAQKEIRKDGHAGWGNLLDEVITEIERLRSGWISVEDRLPMDARPVIVAGGCGHYSHKYKQWFTNMERDCFGEYLPIQWEVTHWMPLPQPPQEPK